ncbi:FAD dependent oxidoreductase [Thalassoporum mexicanum PCC 7367]|uniref:NAD(P)/FAD-dependent oxidoreductase n=1 Tax=Thalassoporum mexicanum TaxID=3457544 RepID=UPI00029FBC92|nr:FAD-dependent oxidoreductase [Pseudanabaena sp. PCC 7367]AFY69993.1 FAD dependent oxidoreductase [Pseudanabaena sp. PCC 7367]
MAQQRVVIIGGGIVGTTIAYLLSQSTNLHITVLEANHQPGKVATGASLGVLMAACSQRKSGDSVRLRLASLRLYETLIPELVAKTGLPIRYNQAGIVNLFNPAADRVEKFTAKWQKVIEQRHQQGFRLQWLDAETLRQDYPQFQASCGLLSPSDRAVDPHQLITALVMAAQQQDVEFRCNFNLGDRADLPPADWYVIAAGVGSDRIINLFTASPQTTMRLMPVAGQAIKVRLNQSHNLALQNIQSVVHGVANDGSDINIVPLGNHEYWLGATVEFAPEQPMPHQANVDLLLDRTGYFCPAFSVAEVLDTWAGDRPRPVNQSAPILGFWPDSMPIVETKAKVILATGHYRNGVLMAPVTAKIVGDLITKGNSDLPWQRFQLKSDIPRLGQQSSSPPTLFCRIKRE